MKNMEREIEVLKMMEFPSIIRLYETIWSNRIVVLVMEYIGSTNLMQYLKKQMSKKLPERKAKKIFKQIVEGVNYLHKLNIIHRDIKLENIIVSDEDQVTVKMIDFGFALQNQTPETYNKVFCGTPCYMAPEIVSRQKYRGQKADCWALGVLLYVLLMGQFPFRNSNSQNMNQ